MNESTVDRCLFLQEVGLHGSLALDRALPAALEGNVWRLRHEQLSASVGAVDLACNGRTLHSACHVDGISKQRVPGENG